MVLPPLKVTPGDMNAAVTWTAPQSTCSEAIRSSELPQTMPGSLFSIGQHTVIYKYNIDNRFEQRCAVMIDVRGRVYINDYINATWEITVKKKEFMYIIQIHHCNMKIDHSIEARSMHICHICTINTVSICSPFRIFMIISTSQWAKLCWLKVKSYKRRWINV